MSNTNKGTEITIEALQEIGFKLFSERPECQSFRNLDFKWLSVCFYPDDSFVVEVGSVPFHLINDMVQLNKLWILASGNKDCWIESVLPCQCGYCEAPSTFDDGEWAYINCGFCKATVKSTLGIEYVLKQWNLRAMGFNA